MTDDALRRIDTLVGVGLRLARSAPTGKVLLARIALSLDPAWLPRPWGDEIAAELEQARAAACEPIDSPRVERVLREAWGARPAEELDELDLEPVAVTPSAQVHRGQLDGAPVAIKLRRPGLAASVRQDLSLLEGLLAPLGAAFPALDPAAVLREFRERVLDELDLEYEAGVQRRFHRLLRDHPFVAVPAPVMRLAHEDVLVTEWVEGVPMWQAPDPDQAAARLIAFALGTARAGIVHADIDPDDVLVRADGGLAILDFGAARTVDRGRVGTATSALEAFATRDAEGLGRILDQLNWLPATHGATVLELATEALGELAGPEPSRLDSAAVTAARDRLFARSDALATLILSGSLPPEDLWPARGLAQLFGTVARVGATGPWRELVQEALSEGGYAACRT